MAKLVSKEILISAIRKSKYHWDREITVEDVDDLADSIEQSGQFQPIIVRPIGKAKKFYELIAGERRYLAQKRLKATRIPCVITKCNDVQAEIMSLEENLKHKRPSSKEWAAGAKRLRDLIMKRDGGEPEVRKPKDPKKKTQLLGAAPNNQKGSGRKPSAKRKATKKAAKMLGVSESKTTRAIKREEDLIPSASRALERGTITVEQADRLTNMSVKQQQAQLPTMIKETRQETRERVDREKADESGTQTEYAVRAMAVISDEANNVRLKVGALMEYVDNRDLNYDAILKKVDLDVLGESGKALLDLVDFLGQ